MRRGGRSRLFTDWERVLTSIGGTRHVLRQAQASMAIHSQLYRAAGAVIDAIDLLAGALTGDRERFHLKAHDAPFPPVGKGR
jgi:hypothetical protein